MSVMKETSVWCDNLGCSIWDRGVGNSTVVRKELSKNGWKFRNKKDYCPTCASKLGTEVLSTAKFEREAICRLIEGVAIDERFDELLSMIRARDNK